MTPSLKLLVAKYIVDYKLNISSKIDDDCEKYVNEFKSAYDCCNILSKNPEFKEYLNYYFKLISNHIKNKGYVLMLRKKNIAKIINSKISCTGKHGWKKIIIEFEYPLTSTKFTRVYSIRNRTKGLFKPDFIPVKLITEKYDILYPDHGNIYALKKDSYDGEIKKINLLTDKYTNSEFVEGQIENNAMAEYIYDYIQYDIRAGKKIVLTMRYCIVMGEKCVVDYKIY